MLSSASDSEGQDNLLAALSARRPSEGAGATGFQFEADLDDNLDDAPPLLIVGPEAGAQPAS